MTIRNIFHAAALATLISAGSAQALPLLTNGSFEADIQADGSFGIYPGLTGWSAAPDVELRNNNAGAAQDGVNFVELDAFSNSAIFQNVNTVAGQRYRLSFWYSPRSGVSAASNPIVASWGGNQIAGVTADGTNNSGNVWQQYSFNLLATGALTEVRFAARGHSDSYGGSLDNVTLAAIPEPATLAMFTLGLGLLGFAARRKQS